MRFALLMGTSMVRLFYKMRFEQKQGLIFSVEVSIAGSPDELMELARMNWDCNVQAGCRPMSQRP